MEKRLDRTSEVYAGSHGGALFTRHHRARIHWMCSQSRGKRVLDLGCSQGIVSLLLAREGFEVVGVDIEPELVAQAQAALAEEPEYVREKVRFLVANPLVSDLELGRFDTIIAGEILEHLTQPERLIVRSHELLEEGGILVLTTPFGVHPHPDHKHTFYLTEVMELLTPRFSPEAMELIHTPAGAASLVPLIAIAARRQTAPFVPDAQALAEWLAFSTRAFRASEERYLAITESLESQRVSLRERVEKLQTAQSDLQKQERALREQLALGLRRLTTAEEEAANQAERARKLQQELGEAERKAGSLTQARDLLREDVRAHATMERQLRSGVRDRDHALLQLRRRLALMEDATSYRLGLLLVRCAQRPYRLLLLPYHAAQLVRSALRRRGQKRKGRTEPRLAPLPRELAAIPESPGKAGSDRGAASVAVGANSPREASQSPPVADETVKLLLSGLYEHPGTVRDLKVAAIFDEFSRACFGPECHLVTFRPDNWRPILERERPHLLLVESAWKGNGGSWEYRVASYNYPGREELGALVRWCRENGIPTAFWNKEDPVHFARFLEAAKLFDVVFTTDANCLPEYRAALGHDRVHALPFAMQPQLHNPIRVPGYRARPVCFAGSYYANRHAQRREEMEWLLDAAMEFQLEILDRNYGGAGTFSFPERFAPALKGGLPYQEMVKAYKQYRLFLNVNSVTDSPTMFSRRVFELLACGTPVVSTPARGLTELLGEGAVRIVTSRTEAAEAIRSLLADQEGWERLSLTGQRLVHASHTYEHRLQTVARHLGYGVRLPEPRRITAVTWTSGEEAAVLGCTGTLAAQRLGDFETIIACAADTRVVVQTQLAQCGLAERSRLLSVPDPSDGASWWPQALKEASGDFIAFLRPGDHYGPWYMADLVRALVYSDAEVVGKAAHFTVGDDGAAQLTDEEQEYSFVTSVLPATMLARREVAQALPWPDSEALRAQVRSGTRAFAADRYNYLRGGTPSDSRADR